jgi:Domain of unknown function (DUF1902)
MAGPVRRTIRVQVLQHEKTGLLAAISPDLHGLVVHGHSHDELRERLPGAIRDMIEAEGDSVVDLVMRVDDRLSRAGFGLPAFVADASLEHMRS